MEDDGLDEETRRQIEEKKRERQRRREEMEEQFRKEEEERKRRLEERRRQIVAAPAPPAQRQSPSVPVLTSPRLQEGAVSSASPKAAVKSPEVEEEEEKTSYDYLAEKIKRDEKRERAKKIREMERQLLEDERKRAEKRKADVARLSQQTEALNQALDRSPRPGFSAVAVGGSLDPAAASSLGPQQANYVEGLLREIERLQNAAKGSSEVQLQLAEKNKALEVEAADLKERLKLYQLPSVGKTAAYKTPEAKRIEPPPETQAFPKIEVGSEVLAQFSEVEWFHAKVLREEDGEKWWVKLDSGDESTVRKEKVFPPFKTILETLSSSLAAEVQLRDVHAKMEDAYVKQIEGMKDELKRAREDYEAMKKAYGVDVRQLFGPLSGARDATSAMTRLSQLGKVYSLESAVACHVSKEVAKVDEFSKGTRRWFTANNGDTRLWAPLSDRVDEITQPRNEKRGGSSAKAVRLFQLYRDGDTNSLEVAQARVLCEKDLRPNRVSILDTFHEIYVWVGSDASQDAEKEGVQAAMGMVRQAPDGRSPMTPVVVVNQGREPNRFRAWFGEWAKSEKAVGPSETPGIGSAVAAAAVTQGQTTLPYHQLSRREGLPDWADPEHLEEYLSEEEFEKVFGCRRLDFVALPEWRQKELRSLKKLF